MNEYKLTGGARIGIVNSSYPFAKLTVLENKLELKVVVSKPLVFSPSDIISIEAYTVFPIIGQGIKIIHRVSNYKKKIIFWTFKNPQGVIDEIRKTGFLDHVNSDVSIKDEEIIAQQKLGGLAIKKSFLIGAIITWNLLFAVDLIRFIMNPPVGIPNAVGIKIAIGLLLVAAVMLLFLKPVQTLVLKEGREVDEVKKILYLVIGISSFMFLNLMLLT